MTCIEMDFFPANFMLQNPHENDHQPPSSLLPPCTSQDFHGVASFLGKRSMSFSAGGIHHDMSCHQDQEIGNNNNNNNGDDDLSDDGSQLAGEKKRRLNMEQVKTLEKNFELGNKLEPERKMQLARALGLQPRQIAIWFQNRRARWKTKQLEKDYDVLKRQFDAVKADNDALQSQNQKLQAEILALKNREPTESINLNKETEGSCSNSRSENSSDDHNNNIKLDIISRTPPTPPMDSPLPPHPTTTTTCSMSLFPPPIRPTSSVAQQLFHNSSSSSSRQQQHQQQDHHQHLQFQKIIHDHGTIKEETFTNMFCGIDDQSGFWPWLEQQQFN